MGIMDNLIATALHVRGIDGIQELARLALARARARVIADAQAAVQGAGVVCTSETGWLLVDRNKIIQIALDSQSRVDVCVSEKTKSVKTHDKAGESKTRKYAAVKSGMRLSLAHTARCMHVRGADTNGILGSRTRTSGRAWEGAVLGAGPWKQTSSSLIWSCWEHGCLPGHEEEGQWLAHIHSC